MRDKCHRVQRQVPWYQGHRVPRTLCCALLGIVLLGLTLATTPATTLDDAQRREMNLLLGFVSNTSLSVEQRRDTARALLDRNWAPADAALAQLLRTAEDSATRQAIAQGAARAAVAPSGVLAATLLDLLKAERSAIVEDLAAAVGRSDDPAIIKQLTALALDNEARTDTRRAAILALAQQRTRETAGNLIKLTDLTHPQPVRDAAFDALGILTGNRDNGRDQARWQKWWSQHRHANEAQWNARLIESYVRRNSDLADRADQLEQRLIQEQHARFRATAPEQRGALVEAWLGDRLEATRRLGLDLAGQMLQAGTISAEIRAALIKRIEDSSPVVRERAVGLLRDLVDKDAAKLVAQRLFNQEEDHPQVLAISLSMMARLPHAEAVEPALDLLKDPVLGEHAAAALVRLLDARMVGESQLAKMTQVLRTIASGEGNAPAPKFIELIGRVAGEREWAQIEGWLGHRDSKIKEAAARAWAGGDQSLLPLAKLADDPVVQPILYAEVSRRGDQVGVLRALLEHVPEQETLLRPWRGALVAMATRVEPVIVIDAVHELRKQQQPAEHSRDMLTSAITRLQGRAQNGTANNHNFTELERTVYIDLLLLRGDVRLEHGDADGALSDYQAVDTHANGMSRDQVRQRDLGLVAHRLATNDLRGAVELATRMLGNPPDNAQAVQAAIAEVFLQAMDRYVAAGNRDRAREALTALRQFLGDRANDELRNRIARMAERIDPPARDNERGSEATASSSRPTASADNPAPNNP